MLPPETLARVAVLLDNSRQLCQAAMQLRDRGARLLHTSAILRADAARLREESARLRARLNPPLAKAAPIAAAEDCIEDTPHDAAMEVLRVIRSIIDPFPIEWQVAIVKALTARTILKAHERIQPSPSTALSA
jgi:hypothetical protein